MAESLEAFDDGPDALHLKEIAFMKHVLVTGVFIGIGYAAAQAFVLKDYHVYGSVRRQLDAEKIKGPRPAILAATI